MKVTVNGEARELAPGTTVAILVTDLGREPRGMAVAVNEELVPKSGWIDAQLRAGDRVEMLGATQGG